MTTTVITGIRATRPEFGVYVENLKYCVESLKKQTVRPELVIVDYGSIPYYQEKIKDLAKSYGATYMFASGDIWSRSRALNVGVKAAKNGLLLIIDVDCVLPPNYVESHIAAHRKNPNICTYSLVFDTFGDIQKSSDYLALVNQSDKLKKPRIDGLSHIGISKVWFAHHTLYDENYTGWGAEDDALWLKIRKSQVNPTKVDTLPVHLWHPDYGMLLASIGGASLYRNLVKTNRDRYFAEVKRQ